MVLAKAGLEVTALEKEPRVGGRTSAIESEGYCFDLGPTFFLYPQILEEIFNAVGTNGVSVLEHSPRQTSRCPRHAS